MPNIKDFTVIGENVKFGVDVLVWPFTSIGAFCRLGDYVVIGSHCYIGNASMIGDGSRIQTGVFLPNRSYLGKNVFLGPQVCCTDDRYPRVGNHDYEAEPPRFMDNCSVGAAAVILPGVTIGAHALVGAGCVVTKDVPEYAVVVGNPSRIISVKESQHA